ncbi:MAG: hypothetical protein N4A44_01645 [Alphaproteobacteria bacterium]|jgi:hypothetical protein|nr:hypothetical protein [Alphaproteobacteria bacterium]
MPINKEYRIVTISETTYYIIRHYLSGYVLEKYSVDKLYPRKLRKVYPKHFNVFKCINDYLCDTKEDVLEFFKDNYEIELDMSIFE